MAPSTENAASGSSSSSSLFDSIEDTVQALREGQFVVVLDDEDRENEGDLIIPAEAITTEQMAWFIKHSSGFICISLHPRLIASLDIPMMVPHNTEKNKTAYTVTVDYVHGTTTGISAHDRALTARKLAEADKPGKVKPEDFTRPGHLNPLRYTEGGVRRRVGHTEASVDLAVAAGFAPAALLCELVDPSDPQGGIAARDSCLAFAREHNLRITSIEKLRKWREEREGEEFEGKSIGDASNGIDEERGVKLPKQAVAPPAAESA